MKLTKCPDRRAELAVSRIETDISVIRFCEKCGHEWDTKSKLTMVTCPSCLLKVKIVVEGKQ